MEHFQTISIFFPMYNELGNIRRLIEAVEELQRDASLRIHEVLLIDDGSRDGCDREVEDWAAVNPFVRLVRHERNMGYGVALKTGFQEARGEAVFYTDSDLPVDLSDIRHAIPKLAAADVVIGYRIDRHETIRRAVFSRIYNRLMRVMFRVRVRDVNFSFKLVSRPVLEAIHLDARTVFIDGQLLAEAVRAGFRIAEIPIEYTPRRIGKSNFDSFRTAWRTFSEMAGYWARSR